MFITDLHIRTDSWLAMDTQLHDWRMYYTFGYAMSRFEPQVVIVLGDLFDTGYTSTDSQFDELTRKFHRIFTYRFDWAFNGSSVQWLPINGIDFVAINSITMDGDDDNGCPLCPPMATRQQLRTLAEQLCRRRQSVNNNNITDNCHKHRQWRRRRPIVLTHYPLYRQNEAQCGHDWDSIPDDQRYIPYRTKLDCLSRTASQAIVDGLGPRLVVNGHTHYDCRLRHWSDTLAVEVDEWTVASFNYRNLYTPTILLATITADSYSIRKCLLVNENK
ncbi:metallophosphoesterase 1-like [Oppia nitens]|uniref:metallophosphoesterase 1-like n=1 Tax=Oppia nitens TaxID=1686743 RepID=UPI0023D9EEA3|nr:metallophosphoesterase 1-like [Oppia nitens]